MKKDNHVFKPCNHNRYLAPKYLQRFYTSSDNIFIFDNISTLSQLNKTCRYYGKYNNFGMHSKPYSLTVPKFCLVKSYIKESREAVICSG